MKSILLSKKAIASVLNNFLSFFLGKPSFQLPMIGALPVLAVSLFNDFSGHVFVDGGAVAAQTKKDAESISMAIRFILQKIFLFIGRNVLDDTENQAELSSDQYSCTDGEVVKAMEGERFFVGRMILCFAVKLEMQCIRVYS